MFDSITPSPTLGAAGDEIALIAVIGGLTLGFLSMVGCFIRSIYKTRAREHTKREIAAYIAEGTMTPEDGERLIKADLPHWERGRS